MHPIMEINMPQPVPFVADNGNCATPPPPRLKRSPYLATMCTSGQYGESMVEEMAPPTVVGEPSMGEYEIHNHSNSNSTASFGAGSHAGSRRMSSGSMHSGNSSANGANSKTQLGSSRSRARRSTVSSTHGSKRHYADFFELKRGLNSSIVSSPDALNISLVVGTTRGGSHHGRTPYGQPSRGPSASSFSSGNFSVGSNVSPSPSKASVGGSHHRMGTSYPNGRGRARPMMAQRMPSVHSLPGSSHHGAHRRPSGSLQYYYPNTFSQGSLLSLTEVRRRTVSSVSSKKSKIGVNNGASTSSDGDDEESSGDGDSSDSESRDKVRMRGQFPPPAAGPWAVPHQGSSSQQSRLRSQHQSLPAFAPQNHCGRSASAAHFFPSVLDQMDGREYDLNRESRNEAWKEIGSSRGEDDGGMDVCAEEDAMEEDCTRSHPQDHPFSGSPVPCVSDDNQGARSGDDGASSEAELLEDLLARSARAHQVGSPRSSGNAGGLASARRSLTVGAGLAYGRIPDWHVRSTLSRG